MNNLLKTFSKFLVSGGINFGLTYAIYLAALLFFPYKLSYSIAYLSGIVFSYFINRAFVFQASYTKKQLIIFPLIYVFQYGFGILLSILWVDFFLMNEKWVPIFTTIISMPVTFILMRMLFAKK